MSRKQREYDKQRYRDAEKTLREGIKTMRRTKEYRTGKPITPYALWKHTDITIRTIKKHPEIMDILDKATDFPEVELKKSAVIDIEKIHTLDQAKGYIVELMTLYNETKDEYNEAVKVNTSLNLEAVKLQDDIAELNRVNKNLQERINK